MTADVAARLAELDRRFALPAGAQEKLARLLELVAADPRAPTAIRTTATAVDAHIADALVALSLEQVAGAHTIADLGSGAGFPGLVLAVALPEARVALVESNMRKCEFLDRAIAALELGNASTVPERAESWREGLRSRDLVTARALAPLAVLVEYAAPLLKPGGALVAWKGRRDASEEADGAAAASATGLQPVAVHPVTPWTGVRNHHLHLYVKVGLTPNRYPRRPGMASKRPIAGST